MHLSLLVFSQDIFDDENDGVKAVAFLLLGNMTAKFQFCFFIRQEKFPWSEFSWEVLSGHLRK